VKYSNILNLLLRSSTILQKSKHSRSDEVLIMILRHCARRQSSLLFVIGTFTLPQYVHPLALKSISVSEMKLQKEGLMMILSPAKTMDLSPFQNEYGLALSSPECDLSLTKEISAIMSGCSETELKKLLSVSANIAAKAHEYWSTHTTDAADRKPSIYAFSGQAYQGLQIHDCDKDSVQYMQDCLRIIDPVYGALRPLDRIQAYRLEMATKGVFPNKKLKLADRWSPSVTKSMSNDLNGFREPVLLNLASDEYSAALDQTGLPENAKFVKVIFRENGRVVTVHAKKARGMMVNYVATNRLTALEEVKKFDWEGYRYQKQESDALTLVFDRPKQPTAKRTAATSKPTAKRRKA